MQSRAMSLIESLTNIAVGLGVSLIAQIVIFPLFGITLSVLEDMQLACIFTAVSLVRSYVLRRLFERFR